MLAVERRFQTHVQGEVVDRSRQGRIAHHPGAVECRIARTEGPLPGIDGLHDAAILADQDVITHLVVVVGMGVRKVLIAEPRP